MERAVYLVKTEVVLEIWQTYEGTWCAGVFGGGDEDIVARAMTRRALGFKLKELGYEWKEDLK